MKPSCCNDPFCEGHDPLPVTHPLTSEDLDEYYEEWLQLVEEARWEQEETLLRHLFR